MTIKGGWPYVRDLATAANAINYFDSKSRSTAFMEVAARDGADPPPPFHLIDDTTGSTYSGVRSIHRDAMNRVVKLLRPTTDATHPAPHSSTSSFTTLPPSTTSHNLPKPRHSLPKSARNRHTLKPGTTAYKDYVEPRIANLVADSLEAAARSSPYIVVHPVYDHPTMRPVAKQSELLRRASLPLSKVDQALEEGGQPFWPAELPKKVQAELERRHATDAFQPGGSIGINFSNQESPDEADGLTWRIAASLQQHGISPSRIGISGTDSDLLSQWHTRARWREGPELRGKERGKRLVIDLREVQNSLGFGFDLWEWRFALLLAGNDMTGEGLAGVGLKKLATVGTKERKVLFLMRWLAESEEEVEEAMINVFNIDRERACKILDNMKAGLAILGTGAYPIDSKDNLLANAPSRRPPSTSGPLKLPARTSAFRRAEPSERWPPTTDEYKKGASADEITAIRSTYAPRKEAQPTPLPAPGSAPSPIAQPFEPSHTTQPTTPSIQSSLLYPPLSTLQSEVGRREASYAATERWTEENGDEVEPGSMLLSERVYSSGEGELKITRMGDGRSGRSTWEEMPRWLRTSFGPHTTASTFVPRANARPFAPSPLVPIAAAPVASTSTPTPPSSPSQSQPPIPRNTPSSLRLPSSHLRLADMSTRATKQHRVTSKRLTRTRSPRTIIEKGDFKSPTREWMESLTEPVETRSYKGFPYTDQGELKKEFEMVDGKPKRKKQENKGLPKIEEEEEVEEGGEGARLRAESEQARAAGLKKWEEARIPSKAKQWRMGRERVEEEEEDDTDDAASSEGLDSDAQEDEDQELDAGGDESDTSSRSAATATKKTKKTKKKATSKSGAVSTLETAFSTSTLCLPLSNKLFTRFANPSDSAYQRSTSSSSPSTSASNAPLTAPHYAPSLLRAISTATLPALSLTLSSTLADYIFSIAEASFSNYPNLLSTSTGVENAVRVLSTALIESDLSKGGKKRDWKEVVNRWMNLEMRREDWMGRGEDERERMRNEVIKRIENVREYHGMEDYARGEHRMNLRLAEVIIRRRSRPDFLPIPSFVKSSVIDPIATTIYTSMEISNKAMLEKALKAVSNTLHRTRPTDVTVLTKQNDLNRPTSWELLGDQLGKPVADRLDKFLPSLVLAYFKHGWIPSATSSPPLPPSIAIKNLLHGYPSSPTTPVDPRTRSIPISFKLELALDEFARKMGDLEQKKEEPLVWKVVEGTLLTAAMAMEHGVYRGSVQVVEGTVEEVPGEERREEGSEEEEGEERVDARVEEDGSRSTVDNPALSSKPAINPSPTDSVLPAADVLDNSTLITDSHEVSTPATTDPTPSASKRPGSTVDNDKQADPAQTNIRRSGRTREAPVYLGGRSATIEIEKKVKKARKTSKRVTIAAAAEEDEDDLTETRKKKKAKRVKTKELRRFAMCSCDWKGWVETKKTKDEIRCSRCHEWYHKSCSSGSKNATSSPINASSSISTPSTLINASAPTPVSNSSSTSNSQPLTTGTTCSNCIISPNRQPRPNPDMDDSFHSIWDINSGRTKRPADDVTATWMDTRVLIHWAKLEAGYRKGIEINYLPKFIEARQAFLNQMFSISPVNLGISCLDYISCHLRPHWVNESRGMEPFLKGLDLVSTRSRLDFVKGTGPLLVDEGWRRLATEESQVVRKWIGGASVQNGYALADAIINRDRVAPHRFFLPRMLFNSAAVKLSLLNLSRLKDSTVVEVTEGSGKRRVRGEEMEEMSMEELVLRLLCVKKSKTRFAVADWRKIGTLKHFVLLPAPTDNTNDASSPTNTRVASASRSTSARGSSRSDSAKAVPSNSPTPLVTLRRSSALGLDDAVSTSPGFDSASDDNVESLLADATRVDEDGDTTMSDVNTPRDTQASPTPISKPSLTWQKVARTPLFPNFDKKDTTWDLTSSYLAKICRSVPRLVDWQDDNTKTRHGHSTHWIRATEGNEVNRGKAWMSLLKNEMAREAVRSRMKEVVGDEVEVMDELRRRAIERRIVERGRSDNKIATNASLDNPPPTLLPLAASPSVPLAPPAPATYIVNATRSAKGKGRAVGSIAAPSTAYSPFATTLREPDATNTTASVPAHPSPASASSSSQHPLIPPHPPHASPSTVRPSLEALLDQLHPDDSLDIRPIAPHELGSCLDLDEMKSILRITKLLGNDEGLTNIHSWRMAGFDAKGQPVERLVEVGSGSRAELTRKLTDKRRVERERLERMKDETDQAKALIASNRLPTTSSVDGSSTIVKPYCFPTYSGPARPHSTFDSAASTSRDTFLQSNASRRGTQQEVEQSRQQSDRWRRQVLNEFREVAGLATTVQQTSSSNVMHVDNASATQDRNDFSPDEASFASVTEQHSEQSRPVLCIFGTGSFGSNPSYGVHSANYAAPLSVAFAKDLRDAGIETTEILQPEELTSKVCGNGCVYEDGTPSWFATGTYTKTGKPCHRSGRCMGTCGKPEGRDKNATPNIMKAAVHWLLFGRNLFSARKLKEKR